MQRNSDFLDSRKSVIGKNEADSMKRLCYQHGMVILKSLIHQGDYLNAYEVADTFVELCMDEDVISHEEKMRLCRDHVFLFEKLDKKLDKKQKTPEALVRVAVSAVMLAIEEKTEANVLKAARVAKKIFSDNSDELMENSEATELVLLLSLMLYSHLALEREDTGYILGVINCAIFLRSVYFHYDRDNEAISIMLSNIKIFLDYNLGILKNDKLIVGKKMNILALCYRRKGDREGTLLSYMYALDLICRQVIEDSDCISDLINVTGRASMYFEKLEEYEKAIELYLWDVVFLENSISIGNEKDLVNLAKIYGYLDRLYTKTGNEIKALEMADKKNRIYKKYMG